MTLLRDEVWVKGGVHGDGLSADDMADGGESKEPALEVPPAGEEAAEATISAGGDGGPVVD